MSQIVTSIICEGDEDIINLERVLKSIDSYVDGIFVTLTISFF